MKVLQFAARAAVHSDHALVWESVALMGIFVYVCKICLRGSAVMKILLFSALFCSRKITKIQ
jgi:hypothetical protein